MFFDNYPEFVECDVRKDREYLTVTSESLTKRCDAILPKELIQDKTLLDLGSALGAMGHYALQHGASYYCGVEIQKHYRDKSIVLLAQHNNPDFFHIAQNIDDIKSPYDVVIACGFIHGYFDVFQILKKICSLSNKYVIIETHELIGETDPVIKFNIGKMVRNEGFYSAFEGIESVPNKTAVDLIMNVNGFSLDSRIYPDLINNSHDGYRTGASILPRFICRYVKNNNVKTLEDNINDLAIR